MLGERLANSVGYMKDPRWQSLCDDCRLLGYSRAAGGGIEKRRNRVAHSNMFEPWGSFKEHEQLTELMRLLYRLTGTRINTSVHRRPRPHDWPRDKAWHSKSSCIRLAVDPA